MKPMNRKGFVLLMLFGGCAAFPLPAAACSIPVFRYALERWAPDFYEVAVFYRGALSAEDRRRLDGLEERSLRNDGAANLDVAACNLDGKVPSDLAQLWESLGDVPLPHAVVRMPLGRGRPHAVWNGPLAELTPEMLVDSPKRREACKRLLAGDSIVWLLVGDKKANAIEKARILLIDLLPKLADDIPLPEGVGLPGSELASRVPLAVKFSVVEVDPADPAEIWLLRTLESVAPKNHQLGEPLVAALFGRGRVVDVFPAGDIEETLVADVSRFLCGACSCQVKQQNPGFDLLTSTRWERELFEEGFEDPSNRGDAALAADAPAVLVPIPSSKRRLDDSVATTGAPQTRAAESSNDADLTAFWFQCAVVGLGLITLTWVASHTRRS